MRTTIRLGDEERDTLLAIAQERGEKGVNRVVEDAVAFYLSERNKPAPLPVVIEPPLAQGRWQRLGAEIDQRLEPGLLSLVGSLVKDGLRRLPITRA